MILRGQLCFIVLELRAEGVEGVGEGGACAVVVCGVEGGGRGGGWVCGCVLGGGFDVGTGPDYEVACVGGVG